MYKRQECTTVQKLNTRDPKNFRKNTCDKCEFTSDKKTVLRLHLEAVHLNIKKYKCSACSYASYYRPALRKHFKAIHKDGNCRIIKIGCKLCEEGKVHEKCTTVQKSIRKGHKNDRKYVCDKCEFTSNKKILLRLHIEAEHLKIKCYRCSMCDYEAYDRQTLKTHVKREHKDGISRIIKIGCNLCEEGKVHEKCTNIYSNIQIFKTRGNTKKGKYSCDKCDYTSDQTYLLRLHIEAVHLKIKCYRCSVCDYASYYKQILKIHVKSKHENEICRIIKIGCKLCEEGEVHEKCPIARKFIRKGHTNSGKYVCDKCEYKNDKKILLRFHIEAVHFKIKCYRCSVCDYEEYDRPI